MNVSRQFLRFALIGGLNTLLHYGVFLLLLRFFGVAMLLSSTCGYIVGVINSYVLNRTWTFQVEKKINLKEFLEFILVNLVSMGANLLALHFFVSNVKLSPELAQILAIIFSLTINFTGNKLWTFNNKPAS